MFWVLGVAGRGNAIAEIGAAIEDYGRNVLYAAHGKAAAAEAAISIQLQRTTERSGR